MTEEFLVNVRAYDDGAARYASQRRDRSFAEGLYDRFASLVGPGGLILDLGCGPGVDFAGLSRHGLRPVGCDPAGETLRQTKTSGAARAIVQGEARGLPFASASFDGVWACASLLHVPRSEAGRALQETVRVLKPGGVLFTSMMAGEGEGTITSGADNPVRWPRYYVHYRPEEWSSLLAGVSLEVIQQSVKHTSEGVNPGATGWIETFARRPS